MELERINRNESSSELKELHEDVQEAISEFRSTLLELRAAVSAERPLSVVLAEVWSGSGPAVSWRFRW